MAGPEVEVDIEGVEAAEASKANDAGVRVQEPGDHPITTAKANVTGVRVQEAGDHTIPVGPLPVKSPQQAPSPRHRGTSQIQG